MRRAILKFLARKDRRLAKPQLVVDAAVALALAFPLAVHATDGYSSNAYGVKAQNIAGVGIALQKGVIAVGLKAHK